MLERVGTSSFQRTLAGAMRQNQGALAKTQMMLATGKKAATYGEMGTSAMSSISARSMLVREQAHTDTSVGVKQQLDRYDHSLTHLNGAVTDLYEAVGNIIAMGEARGFDTVKESTFGVLRQTLNLSQSGEYIYAGGRSDTAPFTPSSLADLAALPVVEDGFLDEGLKAQARVSDGTDMVYGVTASEIGVSTARVLKDLEAMGPLDGKLTSAQIGTLSSIYGQLKDAMNGVTDIQAANGQRMQQIDIYTERSEARSVQLRSFIGEQEDVDITEVTTRLSNDQLALQASYQAFAQIRDMSLINFLR